MPGGSVAVVPGSIDFPGRLEVLLSRARKQLPVAEDRRTENENKKVKPLGTRRQTVRVQCELSVIR